MANPHTNMSGDHPYNNTSMSGDHIKAAGIFLDDAVFHSQYANKDQTISSGRRGRRPSDILTKSYFCEHCGRAYAYKESKYRHQKACPHKPTFGSEPLQPDYYNAIPKTHGTKSKREMEQRMHALEQMVKQLIDTSGNKQLSSSNSDADDGSRPRTQQNYNINNTYVNQTNVDNRQNTINVFVAPFGCENRGYISDAFLTQCLKEKGRGIVELAKAVHFHNGHPENQNIRASKSDALKHKGVMVYDRGLWRMSDRDTILRKVFDNNYDMLDYHMGNNEDKLREQFGSALFNKVEAWFDNMRNYDVNSDEYKKCLRDLTWMVINETSRFCPTRAAKKLTGTQP